MSVLRNEHHVRDSVSVVIPFYQRNRGLLTNTIRSIFAQTADVELGIIVVDDESPVPAEEECVSFSPTERAAIQIIRQNNGGAASARNRGLEAVREDCRTIALMDSDDIWEEYHLEHALWCLHRGYDFFFSEHQRTDCDKTQFELASFVASEHPVIDETRNLHAVQGDFFGTVLRHSPIGTSTVVFDRQKFSHLRFLESVSVCDDLLFWLDIAHTGCRAAFGAKIQVLLTEGINIYGKAHWASPSALRIATDFAVYHAELERRYALSSHQVRTIAEKRRQGREHFARTVLHRLVRGRQFDAQAVWRFLTLEPRLPIDALNTYARDSLKRLAGA